MSGAATANDRTLAALDPRPYAVGLGRATMRFESVHPQPHDIPMALIVTETGVVPSAPKV